MDPNDPNTWPTSPIPLPHLNLSGPVQAAKEKRHPWNNPAEIKRQELEFIKARKNIATNSTMTAAAKSPLVETVESPELSVKTLSVHDVSPPAADKMPTLLDINDPSLYEFDESAFDKFSAMATDTIVEEDEELDNEYIEEADDDVKSKGGTKNDGIMEADDNVKTGFTKSTKDDKLRGDSVDRFPQSWYAPAPVAGLNFQEAHFDNQKGQPSADEILAAELAKYSTANKIGNKNHPLLDQEQAAPANFAPSVQTIDDEDDEENVDITGPTTTVLALLTSDHSKHGIMDAAQAISIWARIGHEGVNIIKHSDGLYYQRGAFHGLDVLECAKKVLGDELVDKKIVATTVNILDLVNHLYADFVNDYGTALPDRGLRSTACQFTSRLTMLTITKAGRLALMKGTNSWWKNLSKEQTKALEDAKDKRTGRRSVPSELAMVLAEHRGQSQSVPSQNTLTSYAPPAPPQPNVAIGSMGNNNVVHMTFIHNPGPAPAPAPTSVQPEVKDMAQKMLEKLDTIADKQADLKRGQASMAKELKNGQDDGFKRIETTMIHTLRKGPRSDMEDDERTDPSVTPHHPRNLFDKRTPAATKEQARDQDEDEQESETRHGGKEQGDTATGDQSKGAAAEAAEVSDDDAMMKKLIEDPERLRKLLEGLKMMPGVPSQGATAEEDSLQTGERRDGVPTHGRIQAEEVGASRRAEGQDMAASTETNDHTRTALLAILKKKGATSSKNGTKVSFLKSELDHLAAFLGADWKGTKATKDDLAECICPLLMNLKISADDLKASDYDLSKIKPLIEERKAASSG